jgi:hypothetical protein
VKKSYNRKSCEELSPIFRGIINSKHRGKIITKDYKQYERIGDNLLYCLKTSLIVNL